MQGQKHKAQLIESIFNMRSIFLSLLLLAPITRGFQIPAVAVQMFRRSTTLSVHSVDAPAASITSLEKKFPLIPREILFGNPKRAAPKLSPDGKLVAYLAPSEDEVLNVFVRETGENESSERMITKDKSRGIRTFSWAQDSKTILYNQDHEGDENYHLWAVDISVEGEARDLTPGENVKASSVMTNKRFPNEILVGTNERNSKNFDMYRVELATGKKTLEAENPGDVIGWGSEDESFTIRSATVRNQADSSNTIRVRDSNDDEWRNLITFPYGEEGGFVDFCGPDEPDCGFLLSTLGRDTKALLKVDLQTGETIEEISCSDKCDVGGVTLDQDTKKVRAISYNYARTERIFFDKELKGHYDVLDGLKPQGSEVSVTSRTRDEKLWIVVYTRSDGPSEYIFYDTETQTVKPLFVSKPELKEYHEIMPIMEDVRITARDGLDLVAYLTRTPLQPKTVRAPLILLVHGGPWARDFWGFNAQAQWFANRGYSTLQVNFRGSTGYGKTFLHKGDAEWGVGSMQHDLTDAVKWAIDQGIADPLNVCIYGGSYGGYACLAGLAFTPELYKCGVDIVGPSNVKTLLDSIPEYWAPLRNAMLLKIGDVDKDEEFNRKISPLYHIDNIKASLLIGQGANDPRVKQAEADQIAFSMKAKMIPVEYVLYPDEGHGFARPDNRIDFNGRVELFLEKHLGGRAEAFEKPEGSTAVFPLLESE